MALGLVATLCQPEVDRYWVIAIAVAIGAVLGVPAAQKVKMTAMPQMVALFNGVGGGCVALIGLSEYFLWHRAVNGDGTSDPDLSAALSTFHSHLAEYAALPNHVMLGIVAGALIGAISFAGSVVAFLKLQETITGRPITWPLQTPMNGVLLIACVGLVGTLFHDGTDAPARLFIAVALAALLGVTFVLPVGGADMPVIISLLNSFTGISAALAGMALGNSLLLVSGMLVGASGFLLTKMMGEAMNRPITNVLFAGFGADSGAPVAMAGADGGTVRSATADDVAIMLAYARQAIIVPGYGLAVAQAQHVVRELSDMLGERGVRVLYGIHPVAGRMPGHMNVLLAEANVPYEQLKEMDEVNPEFRQTDVVLVIGANDVVNPAAKEQPDSPLYGMPILNVDEAGSVIVLKRSMGRGFAGVDNPLFFKPNTQMLFGDAKASIEALVQAVKQA
jgi:NAD(P) transhydrogenase subunit beta